MAEQSFIFFIFIFLINPSSLLSIAQNPDTKVLLSFKNSCTSSHSVQFLSSWVENSDPCNATWKGVICRHGRVNRLVLEGLSLNCHVGLLSPLPFLSVLSLKNNSFNGSLDGLDLATWKPHLKLLYLSKNQFSGPFPRSILPLNHLRRLDLAGNQFSGIIPPKIGHFFPSLFTLRLENNLFSGEIPDSIISMLQLSDLNLSFNHIEGRIPKKLASFPLSSFVGNLKLCGNPLQRQCANKIISSDPVQISRKKPRKRVNVIIIVASSIGLVVILVFVMAVVLCLKKRDMYVDGGGERDVNEDGEREKMVFFEGREEFSMEELMRGSAEMLGRGKVGTTYRVVMAERRDENGVVVKRVRRERKEEEALMEIRVLNEIGGWRHPNVTALRAYNSSPVELLLVFDFAPNGSLYHLLHGNRGPGRIPIDWQTRFKIAQDAARGLAYLHKISKSNLPHQHLTSSNILIDSNGNGLISDFSLLRLISNPPGRQTSQEVDVYSFGVVLLEILTGRSPEDCQVDLVNWIQTVVKEEWSFEVFDMELWGYKGIEDEMMALLQVALICVGHEVKNRPKMENVYKMIEDIRDRGSRSRSRRSRSRSPSLIFESSPSLSEESPTVTSS